MKTKKIKQKKTEKYATPVKAPSWFDRLMEYLVKYGEVIPIEG